MAETNPTQQCLPYPSLTAGMILAVLADLAEADISALIQSELRVSKSSGQAWRILLPVRPKAMTGGEKAVAQFRQTVKLAYLAAAKTDVGREADQGFAIALGQTLTALEAAIVLAAHSHDAETAAKPMSSRMIVAQGPKDLVAPVVADIVRHGRDVRSAGAHRLQDDQFGAFLTFTDDAENYGSVSSYLRRSDLPVPVTPTRGYSIGVARLWLEETALPPSEGAMTALGQIINAAKRTGAILPEVSDIVYLAPTDHSATILYHTTATTTEAPKAAEQIAITLDPIQPFELTTLQIRPDAEASAALTASIYDQRARVGYRVSIEPLSKGIAPGVDLAPFLEKIEDLELQIAQINALGAPQRRLMRFTDAQLPAMIDGLRKLPPGQLTDGSLCYASSHSAGRAEPAHYLSYDPVVTFMRVAEARWRHDTDPHPISYWLEPFVAEAQLQRPTKTQVFVPSGHFMVPSLAHFGGDVDETLCLVLGSLFDSSQPLIQDKSRSAYYLFTPSPEKDFRLEVEVLDGDGFAPLDQKLHWLNDYLQVRSPVTIDPDRLADVAAGLYEGAAAKALKNDLEINIASLDATWRAARETVEAEALGTINALGGEMNAVSGRIADLHSYLAQAAQEMQALERVAITATQTLKGLDTVMGTLTHQDQALARAREDFESRVSAELRLADTLIEDSRTRIDALQDRLQRIRDWGRR